MNRTQKIACQEYDPEAKDQFVITEGRYYSFMWFIKLPHALSKFGKGGDINGMLWRKDEDPNRWFIQFRFRHYVDKAAFDSGDVKHWYFGPANGQTEEDARAEAEEVFKTACEMAPAFGVPPLKIDYLEIHGDNEKFYQVVQENPPYWMHCQQVVQE